MGSCKISRKRKTVSSERLQRRGLHSTKKVKTLVMAVTMALPKFHHSVWLSNPSSGRSTWARSISRTASTMNSYENSSSTSLREKYRNGRLSCTRISLVSALISPVETSDSTESLLSMDILDQALQKFQ